MGLVGSLGSLIGAGNQSVTFTFNDFNPGEAWGVSVPLVKKTGSGGAAGADFNGILVSVYFRNVPQPLTSACTDPNYTPGVDECHPATFPGQKRSFPSANSADATADTPEASALAMTASGIALLLLGRRGLRRRPASVTACAERPRGTHRR